MKKYFLVTPAYCRINCRCIKYSDDKNGKNSFYSCSIIAKAKADNNEVSSIPKIKNGDLHAC
jgi:hypothetical protein